MKKENAVKISDLLSQDDFRGLLDDYDKGKPVAEIIRRYKLELPTKEFTKALPPKKTGFLCPYCHTYMVTARVRGGAGKESSLTSGIWCPNCYHYLHENCKCGKCATKHLQERRFLTQKRSLEIEAHRKRISKYWKLSAPADLIETTSLTTMHQLYVGIILSSSSFDANHSLITNIPNELCPTIQGTELLIAELLRYRILTLSETSPLEAFSDSGAELTAPTLAHYRLNLVEVAGVTFDDLKAGRIRMSEEEMNSVRFELGVQELVQVLLYHMSKAKLLRSFVPGRRTIQVLRTILQHYTLYQGIFLIYLGVAHTSNQLYAHEPLERKRAQSYVIKNIDVQLKYALKRHSQVKSFHWPSEMKRSLSSHFIRNNLASKE